MNKVIVKILLVTFLFTINPYYSTARSINPGNDLKSLNLIASDKMRFDLIIETRTENMDTEERLAYFKDLLFKNYDLSTEKQELLRRKIRHLGKIMEERKNFTSKLKEKKDKMVWDLISVLPSNLNPNLLREFISEETERIETREKKRIIKKYIKKKDYKGIELLIEDNEEVIDLINLIRSYVLCYEIYESTKEEEDVTLVFGEKHHKLRKWLSKDFDIDLNKLENLDYFLELMAQEKGLLKYLLVDMDKYRLSKFFNDILLGLEKEAVNGNELAEQIINMTAANTQNENTKKTIEQVITRLDKERNEDIELEIFRIINKNREYNEPDEELTISINKNVLNNPEVLKLIETSKFSSLEDIEKSINQNDPFIRQYIQRKKIEIILNLED